MIEKGIGFIFWVIVFGCHCHFSSSNEDDGKSRQTFVIRYKDGEQTIPVTVVLDYKKQTEYVINMNPRTPAKSVTLYDFKQRTIAYKDLTNRECFLGRLTHETLNEEISALQDVKNPVEGKPKVRSLDPKSPALTPTEIRNIAGQKIAVFCRKMNTWLLMPDKVHGISKREADEYEERTYQYHGHLSSQYSHYEQETRRRFRNRTHINPRRRSQRNKNAAEYENKRLVISEPVYYPQHIHNQPSSGKYFSSGNSNNVLETGAQNDSVGFQVPQNLHSSTSKHFGDDKENVNNGIPFANNIPSGAVHSNRNNFGHPNYGSRLASSGGIPIYSRPTISTPNYFKSNETGSGSSSNYEKISNYQKGTSKYFEESRPAEEIISEITYTTTERTNATDVPFIPHGQELSFPNVHPSLMHLLPLHKPLGKEFDFDVKDTLRTRTQSHANNQLTRQRNIESEFHPLPTALIGPDNKFILLTNESNSSQIPDVSVDVLEIPTITKEFENIKNNSSYSPVPRAGKVREYHNSVESYPSISQTSFNRSTYFHRSNPQDASFVRLEHVPLIPITNEHSVVREAYLNESSFPIRKPEIATTTGSHVLTTPEYFVTDRTTSSTVYIPSVHTAFQNSEDFNSFHIFPNYIQNNNVDSLPLERNFTAARVHASSSKFTDESIERITKNPALTTEYPLTEEKRRIIPNHRSDIPSEESTDRSPLSNYGVDLRRKSYPSVTNNTASEGVPPYRIRYQSALRDFKPDEIIIDIGNIPTHTPPPVTSSFQQRILTTIQPTPKSSSDVIRSDVERRNEQTSGITWRSFHPTIRYHSARRKVSDKPRRPLQNGSISLSQRSSLNQNHHQVAKPQAPINQLIGVKHFNPAHHTNRRQFHYRPNPSSQVRMPSELNHFTQLSNLPPGVSVHPRHPQAPFADMVNSNRPPTMPLVDENQVSLKPHRQRHHRKKDRLPNSCCRLRGKTGAFQSCCRKGGPCCRDGSSRRRMQPASSSCCSPSKAIGEIIPANQIQPPARTTNKILSPVRTEEVHGSDTGSKDRCQKEKMCRTLYESIQKVMVCRNAHVEGC